MRYVIAMALAVGGLMGLAGQAKAQGLPPRCPEACSCYNWTKYSGHCVYPDPRPIPPDPWANRGGRGGCGAGAGGMGGQGMNWHRYLRSPRDFYMYGGCYPACR
jgi:hypothetical protein